MLSGDGDDVVGVGTVAAVAGGQDEVLKFGQTLVQSPLLKTD